MNSTTQLQKNPSTKPTEAIPVCLTYLRKSEKQGKQDISGNSLNLFVTLNLKA
ncbi:MAG: hypothetical protein ACLQO7_10330 [Candidatus Bathyarchaeia archaeon]